MPKRPGVAALLGFLLGLVDIFGIGHIYAGKLLRGIFFLVVGLVLGAISYFVVGAWVIFIYVGYPVDPELAAAVAAFSVAYVVIWIAQGIDAYLVAKRA